MNIGIIAAEEEEMLAIKKYMKNIKEKNIFNLTFYIGSIENNKCILVKCGVGKVNAARTTQVLIDNFDLNYVVNIGSAGAVNPSLSIGDIIVGDKLIQYDFDITELGTYEKGEICGIGKYFSCDDTLINLCKQIVEEEDLICKVGKIGTADLFCAKPEKSAEIYKEFGVECVEMEGGAVAQVCQLDNIPFLVIRSISDTPNGNNKIDFHTYLKSASENAGKILYKLCTKLK